jgi:hypothetical protein
MDLTARIIGDLAWPVAVVVLVVVLRHDLSNLLASLKSVEGPGGLKVKFGRRVAAIERLSTELKPAAREVIAAAGVGEVTITGIAAGVVTPPDWAWTLRRVALESPRAAILAAWVHIEDALQELSVMSGITAASSSALARALREHGEISELAYRLIDATSSVHEELDKVSDSSLTTDGAVAVVNAAWTLTSYLANPNRDRNTGSA